MLRKDNNIASSTGSLRKDANLSNAWNYNNNSYNHHQYRRDSLGTVHSLRKDHLMGRAASRRMSNDSLDGRRNSWDPNRRGSSGSSIGWEEPIFEDAKVFGTP